jgi:DNA-binding Lrp family transcriptional regulator
MGTARAARPSNGLPDGRSLLDDVNRRLLGLLAEDPRLPVSALARRRPEVSECHRISGEDCFLLLVHVSEIAALEGVLDDFLRYGQTVSSFVVATPVPPRPVLPAPDPALSRP